MSNDVQQLIKAEGLLRTGDPDGATAIVNVTRVGRGGLPPVSGDDDDLMDNLIYESLIENFNVCSGCAFFNRRGWGPLSPTGPHHHWGLVEGTLLHFPMPGRELDVLGQSLYTYGGKGKEGQGLGILDPVRLRRVRRSDQPNRLQQRNEPLLPTQIV